MKNVDFFVIFFILPLVKCNIICYNKVKLKGVLMNANKAREIKLIKTRERVYKEIAKKPQDLTTLRTYMIKKNLVESGKKFDKAIEMLKTSGRVVLKAGNVSLSPQTLKSGVFVLRSKGGYVLLDGDNKQYAIRRENSEGFNTNERVNIVFSEENGRIEPVIVSKAEKKDEKSIRDELPVQDSSLILGRVTKVSHDQLIFIPNDRRFTRNIMILNPAKDLPKFQDKICLMRINDREINGVPANGYIVEIKGEAGNPIAEYDAIAENCGANMSWSGAGIEKEIEAIPTEVDLTGKTLISEKDEMAREGDAKDKVVDLRHLAFTTVDPATCKDMDDAIYSTYDKNGKLVVYTAVANVTKYVDLNSEIGKRYIQGGFTVYAPNKAYNILPPQLSTGICSLNPNVDRLALVIRSVINEKTGEPISSKIMDAVINSKEKYSYERAQEICDSNPDVKLEDLKKKNMEGEELSKDEQVILNAKASDILWKGFGKRNSISFETRNEYDVHFNEDFSDIEEITAQEHIPYHKVIEAFMLTANEATAKYCQDNNIPNIYRVHDMPNEDKLAMAYEFFSYLDIPFEGDLSPMGIKRIVNSVKDSRKEKVVNNFLVRLQSKAKYNNSTNPKGGELVIFKDKDNKKGMNRELLRQQIEESMKYMENISHFGLQSQHYSHTTSPIRRISDYVTHKNVLAHLQGGEMIDEKTVLEIAQWANQMQDAVDQAEREFDDLNSAIYCEHHIGEVMHGRVCSFKKLKDTKDITASDILILVEDEARGVKVQIPASDILPEDAKNVTISMYGSAIVNKNNSRAVIKLCDEVAFRLTKSDRITREVTATTHLEKENEGNVGKIITDFSEHEKICANKQMSAKRQRMLNNVRYNSEHTNSIEYRDEIQAKRGKKDKGRLISRTGIEDIDDRQVFIANKRDKIKYKQRKNSDIEESYDDYENE